MIKPKSKAPKLIKFPLTPKRFIIMIANNIANGITLATNNPARKFPRKSTKIKTTINAPSNKFVSTVLIALFTIFVLSKNGSITTPSGSVFCISSIFDFTSLITCELFPPFTIITTAPATSPLPL